MYKCKNKKSNNNCKCKENNMLGLIFLSNRTTLLNLVFLTR